MYLSIITIRTGWDYEYEMLIPKVIGKILKGLSTLKRLNRMLPVGHRYHGYIC